MDAMGLSEADIVPRGADCQRARLHRGVPGRVRDARRGPRRSTLRRPAPAVAIARAVVGQPFILILDAGDQLPDSESEGLVTASHRSARRRARQSLAIRAPPVHGPARRQDRRARGVRGGGVPVAYADLLSSIETYGRLYRLQFSEAESLGVSDRHYFAWLTGALTRSSGSPGSSTRSPKRRRRSHGSGGRARPNSADRVRPRGLGGDRARCAGSIASSVARTWSVST
jgi:hypothetical protein